MKSLLIVSLLIAAGLAQAECYVRLSTNITRSAIGGRPTDVQRLVTPLSKGSQCLLRYRILINDEWATVEGIATGATEDQACATALDAHRGFQLQEPVREKVQASQQLVCSDLPDIQIRPVRIGEIIWESETDIHRNSQEHGYFEYKQTRCRMFTERNTKNGNFYTYQGIICQVNSKNNSRWQVVDKY